VHHHDAEAGVIIPFSKKKFMGTLEALSNTPVKSKEAKRRTK
jgi:hypothetical protein